MAIGWLAIIKSVPWTDVISNAPKLADGAKKLWNAVDRKRGADPAAPQAAPSLLPELDADAELASRLASMEAATADLHSQMLASTELIKALAEQNALLVSGIETSRVRLLWLSAATALIAIVAVTSLVFLLAGRGA